MKQCEGNSMMGIGVPEAEAERSRLRIMTRCKQAEAVLSLYNMQISFL